MSGSIEFQRQFVRDVLKIAAPDRAPSDDDLDGILAKADNQRGHALVESISKWVRLG